jgi:hypothetical protein
VRRRKQGKEVKIMITIKVTQIIIDRITDIRVSGIKSFNYIDKNKRIITIWTLKGEKYELILESDKIENLDLNHEDDWLKPKVYKGEKEE